VHQAKTEAASSKLKLILYFRLPPP